MAPAQIGYIRRVANDAEPPNRIRELRDRIGLSQGELARLAHTDPSTISKLEKGTRGLDQHWMRRLAPHLGATPADLLPREDNPFSLTAEERDLIQRLRAIDGREAERFHRIADAALPYAAEKPAAA